MKIHEIITESHTDHRRQGQPLNEMNERVRQLANQAKIDAANYAGVDIHDPLTEKFAELIVRECLAAILGDMNDQEKIQLQKINSVSQKR